MSAAPRSTPWTLWDAPANIGLLLAAFLSTVPWSGSGRAEGLSVPSGSLLPVTPASSQTFNPPQIAGAQVSQQLFPQCES